MSHSLGIMPCSFICIRISGSKERLKRILRAIWRRSWLLHGINLFSFSTIPSSFISFLFSPKMLIFLIKFMTIKSKSGLFLSIITSSKLMIYLFFIFLSICNSSAIFKSKWNATNNIFSYFLTIVPNFFSSFLSFSFIASKSSVLFIVWSCSAFSLNSLTLTT